MADAFDPNNPFAEQDFGFELVDAPPSAPAPTTTVVNTDTSGIEAKLNDLIARVSRIPTTVPTVMIPADLARKAEIPRVEEKIDKAASDLLASCFRPGTPPKPDEAMKLTQSLVNLGHARQLLSSKK